MKIKKAVVCGAGGFIGNHLVSRLKQEGYWVRGVDLKAPEFSDTAADEFVLEDLRDQAFCSEILTTNSEVYQLAADMGGAGYLFSGENDANVMHNSVAINLNVLAHCQQKNITKIFYSSSACVYPEYNQEDPANPHCAEDSAYPAQPDSDYGWEKLFSERLYGAHSRNYGLDIRIARFHNIFGQLGTWQGGKEKAPAALCRKVAEANNGSTIEIWGNGAQTRSFLHIDECIEAVRRLMISDFSGAINIGSNEMISINDFARMIIDIAGKDLLIENISGPTGVNGRNSDNRLIESVLGWAPSAPLQDGISKTYAWINEQVSATSN